jgi:hypothetical protein
VRGNAYVEPDDLRTARAGRGDEGFERAHLPTDHERILAVDDRDPHGIVCAKCLDLCARQSTHRDQSARTICRVVHQQCSRSSKGGQEGASIAPAQA